MWWCRGAGSRGSSLLRDPSLVAIPVACDPMPGARTSHPCTPRSPALAGSNTSHARAADCHHLDHECAVDRTANDRVHPYAGRGVVAGLESEGPQAVKATGRLRSMASSTVNHTFIWMKDPKPEVLIARKVGSWCAPYTPINRETTQLAANAASGTTKMRGTVPTTAPIIRHSAPVVRATASITPAL